MESKNILQKILTEKISVKDAVTFDNKHLIYKLRDEATAADCVSLINKCYDDSISSQVKCLYITVTRKYCAKDPVRQLIRNLWVKADDRLKEGILWRLLDDNTLPEDWHRNIFLYIKNNYNTYFRDSIISYYGNGVTGLNEAIDSLYDNQFPTSKKWVYLFSLLIYNEIDQEKVKLILKEEKIGTSNTFTREVIDFILTQHLQ